MRFTAPLPEGREVETLRRLERVIGIRNETKVLLSRSLVEPGIFGIAGSVLIWSERLSESLDDLHLEAIFAHEVWHIRRRDNLTAAVHMALKALFWFYPVVWWLGGSITGRARTRMRRRRFGNG
jgi:beta-lactamase regulating signal transducer with metallopeptidase domain